MRAALLQLSSGDDPAENLVTIRAMLHEAVEGGAGLVLTPEVSNIVTGSREVLRGAVHDEGGDPMLAAIRDEAARAGIWVALGSLAVRSGDPDGRLANRSFLIGPDGSVVARYDKIHMFDVDVTEAETHRESAAFRPGTRAVLADTPFARLGLTICYDVRFAALYRRLAQAGAEVILVPAAFTPVTGAAHWEPLLRARAIETGCWILATAQTGTHPTRTDKVRRTHGHSLAVSPWGEVILDAGEAPGIHFVDLDRASVAEARRRIPSLRHDREFEGP